MAKRKSGKAKPRKGIAETNKAHKKAAFLRAYAKFGKKTDACEAIGVTRTTVWLWENDDDRFRQDVLAVEEMDTEELEAEAKRRALEKSDLLMIFMLKARKPDKYRDNQPVKVQGSISLEVTDYSKASEERS